MSIKKQGDDHKVNGVAVANLLQQGKEGKERKLLLLVISLIARIYSRCPADYFKSDSTTT